MKKILIAIAAAMLMLGSANVAAAQKAEPRVQAPMEQGGGGDPVMPFSTDDREMNAAMAEARRTYPQFLAAFRNAPAHAQENYAVKVGLPTTDGSREHIWVDNLYFSNGRLHGRIANRPHALGNLQYGSQVEIETDLISDWTIHSADGAYGSFTTRVMIARMSAQEAAPFREALSPNPLPLDWSS